GEGVHGAEGRYVLPGEHETPDPQGRYRQASGAIAGERPLEDGTLAGELLERRRERDLLVIRRKIVASQAVDDEEKDVGTPRGRRTVQGGKIDPDRFGPRARRNVRVTLEEVCEPFIQDGRRRRERIGDQPDRRVEAFPGFGRRLRMGGETGGRLVEPQQDEADRERDQARTSDAAPHHAE